MIFLEVVQWRGEKSYDKKKGATPVTNESVK